MKRKFSRILGIVATIALLASFLVAPVSADVSEADVTVDPTTISWVNADYTIFFTIHEELDGESSGTFRLPDFGDVFNIEGESGGDSGTITVTAGSVTATPVVDATVDGAGDPLTITPASGAVAWTTPAASDDIAIADNAGLDTTTGSWLQETGLATITTAEAVEDSTVTATTFSLPDYDEVSTTGDLFTITGVVLADSGTITVTSGSVTATPLGGATVAGDTVAVTITSASGAIDWTTPAGAGTIAVEANVDGTTGTWTNTAGPVTFPVTEVTELIVLGALVAGGDTITITFPEDTVLDTVMTDPSIAASKGWVGTSYLDAILASPQTWSHVADDLTLTYTMGAGDQIGASAQVMINITDGITNPTDPGDYILEVETSEEDDAVESAPYEIEVPDVGVLPGIVELYNPAGILMDSDTGDTALQTMLSKAEEGWTIKIGEGEYTEDPDTLNVDVTIEGSGDVEDIIVVGNWTIDVADITIDGLTLDGDLIVDGDDFIIQNCVIDDGGTLNLDPGATDAKITDTTFNVEDDVGIEVNADDTVITDCTFNVEDDGLGIRVEAGGIDTDVSGSTFTGDEGEGVGIEVLNAASNLEVEGSTFDGLLTAFVIEDGTADIIGSTIQNCGDVAIDVEGAKLVTIHNNTITGNDEAALIAVDDDAELVFMMFNTITDNAGDDDLLIDNNDPNDDVDLECRNNWWGDADGPGDDAFSDNVESEPFLPGPIGASFIETAVAAGGTVDFEDDCGVQVDNDDAAAAVIEIVGAAQYTKNPVDAIDDAVGFWDVCVIDDGDVDQVTIRLYTDVTDDTEVYVWGAARGEWLEVEAAIPNLFGGFMTIVVTDNSTPTLDDLGALPFVVVDSGKAAAGAPKISSPEVGATDVSTTPTLAWEAVDDATYEVQIAQDATFAIKDDAATSPTNAFIVKAALAAGQSYYWRVRAVTDAGVGDWAIGVFTTATPEPEKEPPIVIEAPTGPPEITVTMPPATITPAIPATLLWAIIGVGAVLVISLIVLIVRTRRTV